MLELSLDEYQEQFLDTGIIHVVDIDGTIIAVYPGKKYHHSIVIESANGIMPVCSEWDWQKFSPGSTRVIHDWIDEDDYKCNCETCERVNGA